MFTYAMFQHVVKCSGIKMYLHNSIVIHSNMTYCKVAILFHLNM